jgi:hypothetical protein
MKELAFSIFLLISINCLGQNLLVAGQIMNAPHDTVTITVWHDGELIVRTSITNLVYSLVLGSYPHYTIQFNCAGNLKYLHVMNTPLDPDAYMIDVDFRRPEHAVIIRDRARAKSHKTLLYNRKLFAISL